MGDRPIRPGRTGWPLIAMLLALCAAGCGAALPPPIVPGTTTSTPTGAAELPNIAQIELAITQAVAKHDRLAVTTVCPADVPERAGNMFRCVAHTRGRHPRALSFQVTEVGGTYVTFAQLP